MNNIKFIVRTYGDRLAMCKELVKEIPNLIICEDKTPRDALKNNAHFNFENALRLSKGCSCIHLEDDIILCKDFYKQILEVIQSRPNEVIQFFSMRKDDLELGSRYMLGSTFCMAQCFYMPKGMAEEVLKYNKVWKLNNPDKFFNSPLDTMFADYLKTKKIKYWLHIPNLVDHRQMVSAIDRRRSKFRQSKSFRK